MLAFLCYIVMSCIFPFHVSPRLTASTLMAPLSCVTVTSISTSLDLASLPLRPDLWFHRTFPQAYDPQYIQSVFTIWFSEPTSPSLTTSSVGSITIIWCHHQCWTHGLILKFCLSHYPPLSIPQKVLLIEPHNNSEICPLFSISLLLT